MTSYWRNGFYRTNAYGTTSWVEGHWVERDSWYRSGRSSDRAWYWARLSEARAGHGLTSRYINPNADCPVSGAPVFFYQNQFGSRVYFD